MRRHLIRSIASLAALALVGGCVTLSPLRPSALDTPPYSAVIEGIAPAVERVPERLPALEGGMQIAFFVSGTGSVNMATMDAPVALDVKGAAGQRDIALAAAAYDVEVPTRTGLIRTHHVAHDVGITKAVVELTAHRQENAITTEQASTDILSHEGVLAIDATVASADMDSTETVEATGFGDRAWTDIDRQNRDAHFGFLDDAMAMRVDSDFDVIKVLQDQFIVDGFYQNDVLLEGGHRYAITLKEEQAFLNLLRSQATITDLLNRPYSRRFREAVKAGPVHVTITARFVTDRTMHHGQQVLLSLEVSNKGETPAYDLLLLNGLPAHTSFESFPVTATRESGFLHNFSHDSGLLMCRLYRPLMPGQTFKTSVMLRLDRWDVTAQRTRR